MAPSGCMCEKVKRSRAAGTQTGMMMPFPWGTGTCWSFLSWGMALSGLLLSNSGSSVLTVSEWGNGGREICAHTIAVVHVSMKEGLQWSSVSKQGRERNMRGTRGEDARVRPMECGEQEGGGDKELSEDGRFSCSLLIPRTFPEHLQRVRPCAIQAGN